jgi:hypothetical protein
MQAALRGAPETGGATHGAGVAAVSRAFVGARALLLPPILIARILSRAWPRHELRGPLLRALPYLPYFVASWALGEVAGAWAGDGGALARVR